MASQDNSYTRRQRPTPRSSDTRQCLIGFSAICCSIFTVLAIVYIFTGYLNKAHPQDQFTIQSISISPNSSTTWHVDFLVKNPISRYIIYYESDETSVKLGNLNAVVLSTSHEPKSSSHTAFSMDFVAEGKRNNITFEELDIKLKASHKVYGDKYKDAGHFEIKCHNLTRSIENIHKIQCQSSFTRMVILDLS